jgi:uncharacterized protein YndB with AHSA1/START domain
MNQEAKQSLTVSSFIKAPVEVVFDAWLDPEIARRFLFATPEGEMVTAQLDPRVGGQFLFVDLRAGVEIAHIGEYREIVRPQRLTFSFAVPQFSEEFSLVDIRFSSTPTGCEVNLTQEDVLSEWADSSREGWQMILANLAACVEAT